jgi:hypothetical protein
MGRLRRALDLSATVALSASLFTAVPALGQSNASTGGSNNSSASTNTMQLGNKAPTGGQ